MTKPRRISIVGEPAYRAEQREINFRWSRVAEKLAREEKPAVNFTPQINPEWQD